MHSLCNKNHLVISNQQTMNAVFLPVQIWSMRLILVNFRELTARANLPKLTPQIARLLDAAMLCLKSQDPFLDRVGTTSDSGGVKDQYANCY